MINRYHEDMTMTSYQIRTRTTPGATPTVVAETKTLAGARKIARTYRDRRDLTGQDVRIERADGSLVEYAGPTR